MTDSAEQARQTQLLRAILMLLETLVARIAPPFPSVVDTKQDND